MHRIARRRRARANRRLDQGESLADRNRRLGRRRQARGSDLNLLLLEPGEASGDTTTLVGRRADHLRDVLGVAPGAIVRAGIVGGAIGDATVLAVDAAAGAVTIQFAATGDPPPGMPVDIILAVPRPKVLARTIRIAASFGVAAIHLTRSWRVDKAYLSSPRLAPDVLAADARLGAEQGATTRLPTITFAARFVELLERNAALPAGARGVVAHTRGERSVPIERALVPGVRTPVILAIGPEGGWIDREVDSFVDRGYTIVQLAPAILVVEAAVSAALAQIALLFRTTPTPTP
jgi:RsmE family RNA methyltransferase